MDVLLFMVRDGCIDRWGATLAGFYLELHGGGGLRTLLPCFLRFRLQASLSSLRQFSVCLPILGMPNALLNLNSTCRPEPKKLVSLCLGRG